ncbi:MAG: amino acid-binding ACT domain protein [Candidatus Micrarchaeota archaeon]|nr:amino acid-binding ACT domain protein [Candidatus Micrarchaeota archaeon]
MLGYLEERFAGNYAKLKVVSSMLRLGLKVDRAGRIYCGEIELAPAKMGRALGVDRRVVIETAKQIAADPELFPIFSSLLPTANVSGAAKFFGHDVIEIEANPSSVGVVNKVAEVLAKNKVVIRQIIADDPDLYPEPKMHLVVQGRLPQKVMAKLRALGLDSVSFK